MARYIDADKMIEKLNESKRHDKNSLHILLMNEDDMIEFIEKQNTEEVLPVIHAHWIDRNGACVYPEWERYQCSNCKCNGSKNNYCSNCGARMR